MDLFWVFLVSEFLGGKVGLLCDSIFNDIGRRVIICDWRTGFMLYRGISGKLGKKRQLYRLSALLTLEGARMWNMHEYWRVQRRL